MRTPQIHRILCYALAAYWFASLTMQQIVPVAADDDDSACTTTSPAGTCAEKPSTSWIGKIGDMTKQFFDKKGARKEETEEQRGNAGPFLPHVAQGKPSSAEEKSGDNPFFKLLDRLADPGISWTGSTSSRSGDEMVALLIERSKQLAQEEQGHEGKELLEIIQEAMEEAAKQLHDTFGSIIDDIDPFITVAIIYYMAREDQQKNPTWKRRQHRFYDKVAKPVVLELHDALYLSQLAYVDTIEAFRDELASFQNNAWELVFGTTDSTPTMPSHFLLLHKNLRPLNDPAIATLMPWEGKKDDEIEVALVVRGTKHLSDIISDALLEPTSYRGGLAHSGILTSGKALAKRYASKLRELLEHSGRDKIRLFILGHSLGAGAGAIAAMELNELDFINVEAVGFGCPSLVSEGLSMAAKDYITTVIADADIIPRISGASSMNILTDLLSFDWTDSVLDDIEFSLNRARTVLPFGDIFPDEEGLVKWIQDFINREVKPKMAAKKYSKVSNLLIPPGNCIHFFRDGVSFTGAYTPCSFFREIDLVTTLVDDHLIMPGYHRALISFMRDMENDYNFDFVHDIASIPA